VPLQHVQEGFDIVNYENCCHAAPPLVVAMPPAARERQCLGIPYSLKISRDANAS
jgi:hypothetical protein